MSSDVEFDLPLLPIPVLRGHLLMGGQDPAGNHVAVNSRYLERNDLPWLPVMGEFHFARCHESMWEDELRKIKAGGVSVLSSYVFWIHHEESEGQFVWTGRRNLRQFVTLCAKVGLQFALRIGPFCHGECRNGGIPDWLYGRPFEIRSNDPRYLAYVERLYRQIFDQVQGLFFADGGPIVAVQIENEYLSTGAPWETTHFPDTEWQTAGTGGDTHMGLLLDLAQRIGFKVPLWTCTGWGATRFPVDRFIPMLGGYAYAGWQDDPENDQRSGSYVYRDMWNQRHQPPTAYDPSSVPYACCEIGGGMQVFYRNRPVVPAESVEAMNNVMLANGSNLMGSFIYHGGINPESQMAQLNEYRVPRLSYDWQSPLGEYGQRRLHYDLLRRINYLIRDVQQSIATAAPCLPVNQPLLKADDLTSVRACLRATEDGRGFLFLNNFQDHADMPAKFDVRVVVHDAIRGDLIFPAVGRLDLEEGVNLILPFNLDLAGVSLKQAGVQFLASRQVHGETPCFFFFSPPGMEVPHYLFSPETNIDAGGDGDVSVIVRGGTEALVSVPALARSTFAVRTTGMQRRIVTLTDEDSRGFWQDYAGKMLITLLTNAGVIFTEDGFELYQTGDPEFAFSIFSADRNKGLNVVADGRRLDATAESRGFVTFKACVQAWPGGIDVTPLKTGKSHVTFNATSFSCISDLFLRIRHNGDTGMAFVDGKMIHDHFNNGTPWEIGLKQYLPAVRESGVVIRVVPKPSFDGSCTLDAMGAGAVTGGDYAGLEITSVEAVPEYRLKVFNG